MANTNPIIVRKNRKRALGALVIVVMMLPVSGWLLYTGLQPGRPDVAWALVIFGVVGLAAFTASAVTIIRTVRSPWHLALDPAGLSLRTPAYDLDIAWEQVDGILVDQVNRKPGCALIFKDLAAVTEKATFHAGSRRPGAVNDAATMRARLQDNYKEMGYHMGIPGRLLELGPDALAELLVEARTGQIWEGEKGTR